ncbi:hypothetical protein BU14_1778s0001 [Porphyra umbilicalis]|uniref:Uncharacterized protein n=1 Tax=Porphyra umbilicalis TaxID=2786 RepID=A0A1X6NKP6_PORUM|nr:hypothetical protein BU14_1778s0001 [Porphyra umbilicalis]|eukprot:OSX69167.1 hypothetical protein BU14_1778s0001 [Porphyra umbilicalis]
MTTLTAPWRRALVGAARPDRPLRQRCTVRPRPRRQHRGALGDARAAGGARGPRAHGAHLAVVRVLADAPVGAVGGGARRPALSALAVVAVGARIKRRRKTRYRVLCFATL